jgi:hypothetical protein
MRTIHPGNGLEVKVLLLLSEAGTLDHAVAIKNQLTRAGASVEYSICKTGVSLPDWARKDFLSCNEVALSDLIKSGQSYSAFWFQDPYEELFSDEMKTLLTDQSVLYTGYGLPISNWVRGNYGLPFFSLCDLVAAPSPYSKRMFEQSEHAPKETIWTGDPLLFELIHTPTPSSPIKPTTILWAPHWTETWTDGSRGFTRWRETVGPLLKFFNHHASAKLIIRGHPFLKTSSTKDKRFHKKLLKLQNLDNVSISCDSMKSDISKSDALISDGVSIIAYFAATEKPVGFVKTKNLTPPFNSAGRAISESGSLLSNSKEIKEWLTEVAENKSKFVSQSRESKELILQLFPIHESSPGSQIVSLLEGRNR